MFDDREVIANRKCWVEKKEKKAKIIFKLVHCYSPTPPIGRRMPTNVVICVRILFHEI